METQKYKTIMNYIKNSPVQFEVKGMETYSLNGVTSETIVLKHDNVEFVYVDGKKDVLLGWDNEKCSLGENVIKAFEKDYIESIEYYQIEYNDIVEDYEKQISTEGSENEKKILLDEMEDETAYIKKKLNMTLEEYKMELYTNIKENTSSLRKADISSMLVERNSRYIDKDLSYETFCKTKDQFTDTTFALPTEDEWEYLCSGGTRTFFRWGDTLDIDALYNDGERFYKENMFGLHIAYNPYRYELIDSHEFVKGGDGGCSMCGGDGAIYVAPCFSSFYRQKLQKSYTMSKNFYTYRRIIRIKI